MFIERKCDLVYVYNNWEFNLSIVCKEILKGGICSDVF